MKSLVVINACVRQSDSRTLRIAEPIIKTLSRRYHVTRYDLPEMDIVPLTPSLYAGRGQGDIPAWAKEAASTLAQADRILIAAPFWDMSFPAVLKCFFEQTSLFDITFTDNGSTCIGLCKAPKVLYITTRGMDIPTGSEWEQATPYIQALSRLWNLGPLTTIAARNMDYSTEDEIAGKVARAVAEGTELAKTW
ncbi:MAG: NAD(P)H-dependent oxidoreductase [Bacteroidales bacterium]|nr:NAD(P)H-dependent oxidoreductase [Bacteroidales bacterium]